MNLLSKKIALKKQKTVKGLFNIKAMELILDGQNNGTAVGINDLLELNVTLRLQAKFGEDYKQFLADDLDVDGLSADNLDMYNKVSTYIDEVFKTASDQTNAFPTNTKNHRSFNGWASKNNILLHLTHNADKSVITLTAVTVAGVQDAEEVAVAGAGAGGKGSKK